MKTSASRIEAVFRAEAGRVLATLIRLVGDFEYAEDAMQEAFAAALMQWSQTNIPDNPRAWLVNVARHKVIDRIRRQTSFQNKQRELEAETSLNSHPAPDEIDDAVLDDDMLRLIFTCCHPALNIDAQVALTLRAVCSLPTEAVARAFLISEETMAQRLVRAKTKIRTAGIPYETPQPGQLADRIDGVLAVIYLVFTEGYAPTTGTAVLRTDLSGEAIRLARLVNALMPASPAIEGLLALLLLHDARRAARTTLDGELILLEHQDRALWNAAQIEEGATLVERALGAKGIPSVYAVQAAIAALHGKARSFAETDWAQIVGLYEVLLKLQPSPVVALNHAAAVSMLDGPAKALNLIDSLAVREALSGYHLLPAVRADLLRRLDRPDEAREAYRAALALVRLEPERRFLEKRLAELG
jgi:RNA polymerase sigma-70 factor (ECF subfamily)